MERINRQKHLTVAQRGAIIGCHLGGLSNARIANTLNTSDNNSIHTSRMTTQWFAQRPQLEVLNAPVNSPDLNPIENFWGELCRDWVSVFPRDLANLETYVVQRWEEYRGQTQYFQNLFDSMPDRMKEVIDKNGAATKY
ncbi:hypothetical protein HA402_009634 [Bradysia odoriphaga]|nr:hypothetical protein HA402_009634 [Bradysia odoriphaga]